MTAPTISGPAGVGPESRQLNDRPGQDGVGRGEFLTWAFTVSDIQQHSVDLVNTSRFGLITGFLGRR